MNAFAVAILLAVTLQRLSELVISRRNTRRLLAMGGKEVGASHYPLMVAAHAAWVIGLWVLAPWQAVSLPLLAAYLVLQAFRVWILLTLGRRWTTRIITVPNEELVTRGPYRFMRHPNYAVVALEIPLLPMVFGLTTFAIVFGLINLAVLALRIAVEERTIRPSASGDRLL